MKKYTFVPWLRRQDFREDEVGKLSFFIFRGRNFAGLSKKEVERFILKCAGSSTKFWDAFCRAQDEFRVYSYTGKGKRWHEDYRKMY